MSRLPTVSVIIPARNAQATLGACLESVCAVTYPSDLFEICVVDNNSRDTTRAIIESFAPRVQYLVETKPGPAAARNCGIRRSRGKWIAFTDADCVVEPEWLASLLQFWQDETVGIVGGAIRALHRNNVVEHFGEQICDQEKAICVDKPASVASANWASPRRVLMDAGLFDDALRGGEDTDLAWRILQSGKRLVYQPTAIVRHRNARTMRGLWGEGFQHGFNSVLVRRKHQSFLKAYGYRRIDPASYAHLLTTGRAYLATRAPEPLCNLAFSSGKKFGKLVGSLRAGYLEL